MPNICFLNVFVCIVFLDVIRQVIYKKAETEPAAASQCLSLSNLCNSVRKQISITPMSKFWKTQDLGIQHIKDASLKLYEPSIVKGDSFNHSLCCCGVSLRKAMFSHCPLDNHLLGYMKTADERNIASALQAGRYKLLVLDGLYNKYIQLSA